MCGECGWIVGGGDCGGEWVDLMGEWAESLGGFDG